MKCTEKPARSKQMVGAGIEPEFPFKSFSYARLNESVVNQSTAPAMCLQAVP